MSLEDIAKYIFVQPTPEGRLTTIRWLQTRGLLATEMTCSCAGTMSLVKRNPHGGTQDDKWAWKCPLCTNVKSVRSGSWFEG